MYCIANKRAIKIYTAMQSKSDTNSGRTHVFDTTFWQVLPAHYDRIKARWLAIPALYEEASAALMATDRESAINSLKAELEMLEKDIDEYLVVAKSIDVNAITELYLIAGRQRWRAEQIAKEDIDNLGQSLHQLRQKIKEIRADTVYGFEQTT